MFFVFRIYDTIYGVDCNLSLHNSTKIVTIRQSFVGENYGKPKSLLLPGFFLHPAGCFLPINRFRPPFCPIFACLPPTRYSVGIRTGEALTPCENCAILNAVKGCDEDPAQGKKPREESVCCEDSAKLPCATPLPSRWLEIAIRVRPLKRQ